MEWISFKDQSPPINDDILIWNNNNRYGQMIGLGYLDKQSVLKYCYTCFEDIEMRLDKVLQQDFYWMIPPEFKK